MRMIDLIQKKRDGEELRPEEIAYLVQGYTKGDIADYQMAAFLMAVYFQGMSVAERVSLTREMIASGEVVDLSDLPGRKVDKHSTGGVGDKASLILAPLAAAAGVLVPMVSGRGLGHSGGTLDKLESIPGFRVSLSLEEYRQVLSRVGLVLSGANNEIAPADKKMYALRNVTATVESIPLITGSILSKKVAEGIDGLVLDVKVGSGAFMKRLDQARHLAETLVNTGQQLGLEVKALITEMDQPLGRAVGNALEIIESIKTLEGQGPEDVTDLSVELAAQMVVIAGRAETLTTARALVMDQLTSGKGLERLQAVIKAQGGDPRVVDDPSRLPRASHQWNLLAETRGFLSRIEAESVGWAAMRLGAGRERLDSQIDPAVGIILDKKVGDRVDPGDSLCTVHYNASNHLEDVEQMLRPAFEVSEEAPPKSPLIKAVI